MPVTIVKAKTESANQVEELESEIAQKVTRYGELSDKRKPLDAEIKAIDKELKPLRSELQAHVDEHASPDEDMALKSKDYITQFGALPNVAHLYDRKKAFEMLEAIEEDLGWSLINYSITELRKYLTPAQFDEVTQTEKGKTRGLKVVKISE